MKTEKYQQTNLSSTMICKDYRDIMTAICEYERRKGGVEDSLQSKLGVAIRWYHGQVMQSVQQDFLYIPIYRVASLIDDDNRIRFMNDDVQSEIKVEDYNLFLEILDVVKERKGFWVVTEGPDLCRQIVLTEKNLSRDLLFSIFMYAYEEGVLVGSTNVLLTYPAHGRKMQRGDFIIQVCDLIVRPHDLAYQMYFSGRVYSIVDREYFTSPQRADKSIQREQFQEQEFIEQDDVEWDGPELGL
jgi:hypothetical protein